MEAGKADAQVTVSLRRARQSDAVSIRAIIRQAGINPMGIDWRRFLLAEVDGRIVGTGQIKPHGDGSRELASIAVIPEYQRHGIAAQIITALIAGQTGTLYLTCQDRMERYYTRFGFRRIERDVMTPYFRRLTRVVDVIIGIARRFTPGMPRLIVMRRAGSPPASDGLARGYNDKALSG
jgi:N-acetylglutamate synthase-like GNAT family acetyltransferase